MAGSEGRKEQVMKRTWSVMAMVFALTTLVGASSGDCGGGGAPDAAAAARSASSGSGSNDTSGPSPGGSFSARLRGFQEVPAISTTGTGRFEAVLADDGLSLAWTLEYDALEGNAAGTVTGAHLHLGQRGVAGGIAIHLCGGGGGTAACPAPPATLSGTATAEQVVGPAAQGLDAGELGSLVEAMRSGVTYVNVHTTRFPSGEIRGQVKGHRGDGD
jgi:CHRD domain-containing protein